jgi:hypothetical protein
VTIGKELAAALDEEAAGLEGAERRTANGGFEWLVGDVTFAAVGGDVAEFHLSPVAAAAARATPDAGASARGADWVTFSPGELDRYALDRGVAWFGSAYRNTLAATSQESKRPR